MMSKNKRPITAEDLYDINVVTECQISPDGESMVYALQTVDRDSEKKYMHLWAVPAKGGKSRQWTFGSHTDSSPKWSPDGQWIAFLSNRIDEKQPQIFVLPVAGGEACPITDLKGDLANFNWSPDSSKLVFQFREKDPEDIEVLDDPKKKELDQKPCLF